MENANQTKKLLNLAVKMLPLKDQEIMNLYLGLENNNFYNQKQIAKMLDLKLPYVNKTIKKSLSLLKKLLVTYGVNIQEQNQKLWR